jgi:hypothetical protein
MFNFTSIQIPSFFICSRHHDAEQGYGVARRIMAMVLDCSDRTEISVKYHLPAWQTFLRLVSDFLQGFK